MADAPLRYSLARIEGAQTVADSYRHYQANPEVFSAGAQYALDTMLNMLRRYSVGELEIEHICALDVLNRVKKGEPQ